MLWIKALHIVFIASWFATLFYLPRIFVNLAEASEPAVKERLVLMGRRLFRFSLILSIPAIILGLWLYVGYGIGMGPGNGWMHAKIFVVILAIGYNHMCGGMLRKLANGTAQRSATFYRWFNEVPVLFLLVITILVVVKPF